MTSTRASSPAAGEYPRRVNRACDYCRGKKIKCPNKDATERCEECARRNNDCRYTPASGDPNVQVLFYPATGVSPSPDAAYVEPGNQAFGTTLPLHDHHSHILTHQEGAYSDPRPTLRVTTSPNFNHIVGVPISSTPPSSSSIGGYGPSLGSGDNGPDTVPRVVWDTYLAQNHVSGGQPIPDFLDQHQGSYAPDDMVFVGPPYAEIQYTQDAAHYVATFTGTHSSN